MDTLYDSINFIDKYGKRLWSMKGPFSYLLVLGLLAGGIGCLHNIQGLHQHHFELTTMGPYKLHMKIFHPSRIANNEIIKLIHISGTLLSRLFGPLDKVSPYSLYINSYGHPEYDLYAFQTELDLQQFLQGVLTMCNAFNVDPANIIPACPIFQTEEMYNYLAVEGVILPLLPEAPGREFIYPIDNEGIIFPAIPATQDRELNNAYYNELNNDDELNEDFYNRDDEDDYGWGR